MSSKDPVINSYMVLNEKMRKDTLVLAEIQAEVRGIEDELNLKYDLSNVCEIDTAERHALRLCKILRYFKIVE